MWPFFASGYIKYKKYPADDLTLGGDNGISTYETLLSYFVNKKGTSNYQVTIINNDLINTQESINAKTRKLNEYTTVHDSPEEFKDNLDSTLSCVKNLNLEWREK